jgi:hypothetical protein
MFDYILILFYLYILFCLIKKYNYRFISMIIISSSVIQVFDKPFYIQLQLLEYVGLCYLLLNLRSFHIFILKNKLFIFLFIIPLIIGIVDVIIPFEFTTFNFFERLLVFIKGSGRIVGFLGAAFYFSDCLQKKIFNLSDFIKTLSLSIIISSIFAFSIYFGLKSPYNFLKGESYTPNLEDYIFKYRLSGFSYEPRLMGYMNVLNLYLITSLRITFYKKIFLQIFSLICLIFTFSTSGIVFLLYLFVHRLFLKSGIKKLLKLIFNLLFFSTISYLLFDDSILEILNQIQSNIDKRIIFEKQFSFKYFPAFLSTLELHDLPLIYYFDNHLIQLFFGFGYGLGRIYMAPYSWVSDITGTSLNIIGTSTCCEPMVGVVYFLSIGGLFFLFLWIFSIFSYIHKIKLTYKNLNVIQINFFELISSSIIFLLFQIPQSSIIYLFYIILFFHKQFINKQNIYESSILSKP